MSGVSFVLRRAERVLPYPPRQLPAKDLQCASCSLLKSVLHSHTVAHFVGLVGTPGTRFGLRRGLVFADRKDSWDSFQVCGDSSGKDKAGSTSRLATHATGGSRSVDEHRSSGDSYLVQFALSGRRWTGESSTKRVERTKPALLVVTSTTSFTIPTPTVRNAPGLCRQSCVVSVAPLVPLRLRVTSFRCRITRVAYRARGLCSLCL